MSSAKRKRLDENNEQRLNYELPSTSWMELQPEVEPDINRGFPIEFVDPGGTTFSTFESLSSTKSTDSEDSTKNLLAQRWVGTQQEADDYTMAIPPEAYLVDLGCDTTYNMSLEHDETSYLLDCMEPDKQFDEKTSEPSQLFDQRFNMGTCKFQHSPERNTELLGDCEGYLQQKRTNPLESPHVTDTDLVNCTFEEEGSIKERNKERKERRQQPDTDSIEVSPDPFLPLEDSGDIALNIFNTPDEKLASALNFMILEEDSQELDAENYLANSEENVDGIEEETVIEQGDSPLYAGASITLHESFIAILTLCLSFRLTGVCLKAVLDLISLHLPKAGNHFRTSLEYFKKYFSFLQGPKDYFYYCSICFECLEPQMKCSNSKCKDGKICSLVKLSLIAQLQTLFKRKGFYNKLKFDHSDQIPGEFSDVFSGNLYQDLLSKHLLGEGILTFQWYTYGAALYKSSNTSVWPLYLTINELPYEERYKKENLLVAGIWCGPVKPSGTLLVSSAYPDLQLLCNGVNFEVEGHGVKEIKGYVVTGTGDTPGRSIMLNMVQFNGANSCQVCEQPGECRFNCPGVRLFPYNPNQMATRTLQNMKDYAKIGTDKQPHKGVKGLSGLDLVMPDFIRGTTIDHMHQLFGGCSKKVLQMLISSKKEDKKWSISSHYEEINRRLLAIKPPIHVPRIPRSLNEVGSWKMKEHKAWLLDYSLPILKGILPERYFLHHASLVAATQMLNADVVSSESIFIARELLKKYVSQVSDFYDPDVLTINFHLLLHLADIVEEHGPGWVYTCFPLESINGIILSLVHGTRWAERQIAASVQLCLGLPELVLDLPEGDTKTFCSKIMNRRKYKGSDFVDGSTVIGTSEILTFTPSSVLRALQEIHVEFKKIVKFNSIKRGKYVYVAESSKRSVCRDSSIAVFYNEGDFLVGVIQTFLRLFQCECQTACKCPSLIFAYIQELEAISHFGTMLPGVLVPNNSEYRETNNYKIVPAADLKGVCIKIIVGGKIYVSKPTNSKEVE